MNLNRGIQIKEIHLKPELGFLVVLVVGGLLFTLDVFTAQPLYGALVVLGLWFQKKNAVIYLAALASFFIITGYFASGRAGDFHERLIALTNTWLIGALIYVRNRIAEKLKENEMRFQLFSKMSPIGKFHTNAEGGLDFVNDKWVELTGISSDAALGKEWIHLIETEEQEALSGEWEEALKEGKPFSSLRCLRNKNTKECYQILVKAVPITSEDGILKGYIGTLEDLTEHIRAKEIISKSEDWFRNIAENSPVMIWGAGIDKKYNYVNRTWLKYTGRSLEEELDIGWMDGVYEEDREAWFKKYGAAFDDRKSFYTEYRLRRHDGRYRWVADHGKPVFLPDGTFAGYIGTCIDIHAQRTLKERLEQKVRQKTEYLSEVVARLEIKIKEHLEIEGKLARAHERFSKLFTESPAANVISLMESGEIIDCNPAFTKLTGYSKSELVGKTSIYQELISPSKSAELLSVMKHSDKPHESEVEITQKQGGKVWASLSTQRIVIANKLYLLTVLLDTTELKQAEEKIMKALEKEKELNEMKSNFLSVASHEFRTPLSVMLINANLIEKCYQKGEEEKCAKYIGRVKGSIKNMTEVLNDFLTLEKLEENKAEHREEHFNLREFSEDIIEETGGTLKPGQQIVYEHTGPVEVLLDKNTLRNVLFNLLSNAVKYSPEGAKIYIDTEVTAGKIIIMVRDTGIGIPQEEQKNIFSRFYRASNVYDIKGTGLGLNIVKKYVELMNGSIEFTSRANEGTTFILNFNRTVGKEVADSWHREQNFFTRPSGE